MRSRTKEILIAYSKVTLWIESLADDSGDDKIFAEESDSDDQDEQGI